MDNAKLSNGGNLNDSDVNDIKKIVRVLPFAAFLVIWNCVYDQTDANFQSIAQQTDLRFGNERDSTQLSGAVLGVFDPISIVIMIPILDQIAYPLYKKWTGKVPSRFGKATTGLIVASFSMFFTAAFETIRPNADPVLLPNATGQFGCHSRCQFVAPDEQRRLGMEHSHVCIGRFGGMLDQRHGVRCLLLGSADVLKMHPDDLNDGHLEYMFYTVGAVSIVNTVAFVLLMRSMNFGMSTSGSSDEAVNADKESTYLEAEKARISVA
ncbi:hypothetical protein AC1031_013319 [Aphanomyces cochlioides]|nr:hypothetical protein AC1031_013319 [Aphanomyces cochlioides]